MDEIMRQIYLHLLGAENSNLEMKSWRELEAYDSAITFMKTYSERACLPFWCLDKNGQNS